MVLIFDLDALYDVLSFVQWVSGGGAWGNRVGWGWRRFYSTSGTAPRAGRGRIFDSWPPARSVRQPSAYIGIIRADRPLAEARQRWRGSHSALHIVSDGHKVVQANKVAALKLRARVKGVYLTNQYGTARAKPSPYCFELIRNREGCEWSDMMYVGDNPAKDFVGLNPLGVRTVRVLTGQHRAVAAAAGYDAGHRIRSLASLPQLIKALS